MILQLSLSLGSAASLIVFCPPHRTNIWKPRKRRGDNMNKLNWCIRACGIFLLWATTAIALPAQTLTTLHNFGGRDGWQPIAGLVQGTDGNFYGTTSVGGAHNNCKNSCGTVFRITSDGTTTTLHSFDGTDGEYPDGGLVLGTNGKFYGTTFTGTPNGAGTVFSITAGGRLEKLSIFLSEDGDGPFAGLVQGTDGKFYGTTEHGGLYNNGTVFSVTAGGTLTALATFDIPNGENPLAGLVQGTDGDFYGTTQQGGANLCNRGPLYCGTVFKVTANGSLTTMHSFDGTDGQWPEAGLVEGLDGNFYGTTYFDGTAGAGTVFKITPSGTLTTLHSFDGTDGYFPEAGLVQGTDGNFYGTTSFRGVNSSGTIFSITPDGRLTTLYNFCSNPNCADGSAPYAGLVQGTDGNFYGTTEYGGTGACGERHKLGCGTVFSLSVGLGPFIKTNPTSGMVGSAVTILGTDLTNVTNVRFNGIEAKFNIISASEITTTVPTGATSGPVRVITPTGKLQSNVPFRVN
jgi:uncharacterized repeat protein (TIGR03803 family)